MSDACGTDIVVFNADGLCVIDAVGDSSALVCVSALDVCIDAAVDRVFPFSDFELCVARAQMGLGHMFWTTTNVYWLQTLSAILRLIFRLTTILSMILLACQRGGVWFAPSCR